MLARWLNAAASNHPDAPALIVGGGVETFAGLQRKAERLACHLLAQGMTPGARLAAASHSRLLTAALTWTMAYLGTLLPLNPAWPAGRLRSVLELSAAEGVVAEDEIALGLPLKMLGSAALSAAWQNPELAFPNFHAPGEPAQIALMIATSGSTGEPRAVMLSNANLEAAVRAARSRIPLDVGDVWLACLPLYHIGGQSILYRCAEAGAAVVLEEGFDAERIRESMKRHRVTHISLVPAMLARLVDGGPPPPCLKYALVGGGPLSPALVRRALESGWPVCPTYGMSEAASQVATLETLPPDWREGMVGLPLPGMEVEIVDEGGQKLKGPGRIRLRGDMVMAGYLNRDGHSGHGLQDGWFVSGDRGYFDDRGNLVVLGRVDDVLVSGGVNVHPEEVEALLAACPGVKDVGVSAISDPLWGDRVAALVVGAGGEAVLEWCRAHLPAHLRPRMVFSVAGLPRNAMGKLERQALRTLAEDGLATTLGGREK